MNRINRCALIDGDEIAYKGAFACQSTIYTVENEEGYAIFKCKLKIEAAEFINEEVGLDIVKRIEPTDVKLGFAKVDSAISSFLFNSKSDEFRLFLSGKDNFRNTLATLTPYKGGRPARPIFLEEMKDYIRQKGAITVSFLEADDCLSATQDTINGSETIICTQDKDLRTVPGLNYNPNTKKVTTITVDEARYNFYTQLLTGDGVDSIVSPRGLGPTSAAKILKECKETCASEKDYYSAVYDAYVTYLDKGKTDYWKPEEGMTVEDVIYEIANLLHMHRTFEESERWEKPSG